MKNGGPKHRAAVVMHRSVGYFFSGRAIVSRIEVSAMMFFIL